MTSDNSSGQNYLEPDIVVPGDKHNNSFDAEFCLLESTLTEMKDSEKFHDRPSHVSYENDKCSDIVDDSKQGKIIVSENISPPVDIILPSEVLVVDNKPTNTSNYLCSDTVCITPEFDNSFAENQHIKSTVYVENCIVSPTKIENVSSTIVSNSIEKNVRILSSCNSEFVNQSESHKRDHLINNIKLIDENNCDISSPNKFLEGVNKDLKCSAVTVLGGEELLIKHSNQGCDYNSKASDIVIEPVIHLQCSPSRPIETIYQSVSNCDFTSKASDIMAEANALGGKEQCLNESESRISDNLSGLNHDLADARNQGTSPTELSDTCISQSAKLSNTDESNSAQKTNSNNVEQNKNTDFNTNTPRKLNGLIDTVDEAAELGTNVSNDDMMGELNEKADIYCSTPNVTKQIPSDTPNHAVDFGDMSPLDSHCTRGKQNLKRKFIGLQPIEELDECDDTSVEKKIKISPTEEMCENSTLVVPVELPPLDSSSTRPMPFFEVPAKSLLKKWQPSCLSRNISSNACIVLDECGETELEDCSKMCKNLEPTKVDDFEIACQSLTEELMKSSSNIETLEKYHTQVQLESQMDDEKFDEVLKELTMNYELDDKTCYSVKSMDESALTEEDKSYTVKVMEESVSSLLKGEEIREKSENTSSLSESNTTVIEAKNNADVEGSESSNVENELDSKKPVKIEAKPTKLNSSNDKPAAVPHPDKLAGTDEVKVEMDEEDFLLEDNVGAKDKPYVFFEFVSSDPKENEDNYNPEWQKLGRLTSDEERYRAVRDRWRSLVPPDPNRNLTYRQWRAKNKKPQIKLSPLNNNHEMIDDSERSQLCTAVFDRKIKKIVRELEDYRIKILRQRGIEFEELSHVQDQEQKSLSLRHASKRELASLHHHHLEECRALKMRHDEELKRITSMSESKLRILKEASNEVLLFQQFYKGVGARDDNEVCLYLTDIQVQELMETEEMLEQYQKFYG